MNWRLALLIALVATPGPVAISWLALPILVDPNNIPVPLATLQIAAAIQSIVLVVLASVIGTRLSVKVGLRAPAFNALAYGRGFFLGLRPQWLPGAIGGITGATIILCFYAFAPSALTIIEEQGSIPLAARLLYGGISEEVLIRWGLMTLLAWTGWRVLQRGSGEVSVGVIWCAIAISALIFGISHVPSVAAVMGTVPASIVAYITVGNALFGLVAGYLFWRYGLESAIIAHVLTHILVYAVRG